MANGTGPGQTVVQAQYEELATIAQQFQAQVQASEGMIKTVRRSAGALRDSAWKGQGADAFLGEMDQRVFPSLDRLTGALAEASRLAHQVARDIKLAEEEAAALFRGNGSGGGGTSDPPAPSPSIPEVIDEKVNTTKTTYTIEGPKEQKDYAFKGTKADANVYTVKYADGTVLTIVEPKSATAGLHNHSAKDAADAAAYLPSANRKVINTIMLNPITNPADPDWAVKYKDPNFHSYMTAGKAGVVTIYPDKTAKALPDDNYMRGTMIHETGHTWSYKTWGTDETKGEWANWKKAMDADKSAVSKYANSAIAEDVAETIQAYASTKGTPKFEEYRKLYPNRWKMLDEQFK